MSDAVFCALSSAILNNRIGQTFIGKNRLLLIFCQKFPVWTQKTPFLTHTRKESTKKSGHRVEHNLLFQMVCHEENCIVNDHTAVRKDKWLDNFGRLENSMLRVYYQ